MPDRVPVGPFGLGRLDPESLLAQELIERADPLICVGSGGSPFLGKNIHVEGLDIGDERQHTYHFPGVALTRRTRRNPITSACVDFPFKNYADVEMYLNAPFELPDPDPKEYRRWCERVGEQALVLVGIPNAVCLPADWFSPERFCMAWAERSDLVTELVRVAGERVNAYAEKLCKAGVRAFRIVGGEYASVQLGPGAFRRLCVPFDRELIRTMHRHGALAYYHNHGKVRRYLDDFIQIGMDALDPLEAPPWGDIDDLGAARRALGGRIGVVGNLDDMEVLESLELDEIENIARQRLWQAGPGGFVLGGTASGTYRERGARAFLAMCDVVDKEMPRLRELHESGKSHGE
ncbi:MAG: hypothetical protein M5U26_12810 [Planctomycetota bacterium]|nr:hypothetical protein [Planctomycetota bacterium]